MWGGGGEEEGRRRVCKLKSVQECISYPTLIFASAVIRYVYKFWFTA